MSQKWKNIITNAVGVIPHNFNSSLVSAQNRDRLYWTNIPSITCPEDRNIFLTDIIAGGKGYGIRGVMDYDLKKYIQTATARKDGKSNCLVTTNGSTQKVLLIDGTIRHLSITEREILQTLPQGYTDVPEITKSAKIAVTGNCWTVDMISHIFSHIPEVVYLYKNNKYEKDINVD
jgi:DNA (cytosine-5)-methyltransferase 3A